MSVLPLLTAWRSQRKRAATGLLLALLVTVVAACGSGATGASRAAPTPTPTQMPTATATVAPTPAGVYFAADGSNSATVYALDPTTGHVRWSRLLTTSPGGIQIASTDGIIFVVDFFGTMTAMRMEDGTVLWSKVGQKDVFSQPAVDDGILFVSTIGSSTSHGYLDAYRATDGTRLWEHDEGLNSSVDLGAAANGVLYISSGHEQEVDALRGSDGTMIWRATMNVPVAAPSTVVGNTIYLNTSGEVYALNAATGALLWHYKPPQLASPSDETVSVGGGLVFASNSLRLNALHASDGSLAWYTEYHHLVEGASYANGTLYVTASGTLYALHPSDGSQLWTVPLSGNSSWPAVLQGGTLYLSRSDAETAQPAGYLYALNPANGAVLWKYTQSGVGFTNVIVV